MFRWKCFTCLIEESHYEKTELFTTNPKSICLDKNVLKASFVFVFRRDVFKTSWSRQIYSSSWSNIFKTSSGRLQNSLKTCCKKVLKTFSRLLQDVLKTYHQVKLFLLASLREVVNTFLRRTAKMVIYRRICLSHTSDKVMVSVQNLQE